MREEVEFEIVKCLTKYISQWCSICIYHYPQEEQLKHVVYSFFEKVRKTILLKFSFVNFVKTHKNINIQAYMFKKKKLELLDFILLNYKLINNLIF